MTTFNSISEIVNTVANFKKEPFILVPSYTGEYIPNWGAFIDSYSTINFEYQVTGFYDYNDQLVMVFKYDI